MNTQLWHNFQNMPMTPNDMLVRKWLNGRSVSPQFQVPLNYVNNTPAPNGRSVAAINNELTRGTTINGH